MATIFLTGFPGFLGSALVERLLARTPQSTTISCLIQPKFRDLAAARAARIEEATTDQAARIQLYEGDVTKPDLGLGRHRQRLQEETVEIYHLAAVYDLGVERELAMRVNVDGTRHVLAFAQACPHLHRLQYVSTCYVSGRYPGTFTETDLSKSQTFNNHYEETKYLAELQVQQAMAQGLPTTIYRPAIVTGDSRTGETQKYDGPLYYIRWILRQPTPVALLPVVGDTHTLSVNIVPRDFVIDAIAHLSGIEKSLNKVYHLCDPDPPSVAETIDAIQAATGKYILRIPLPKALAKGSLVYLPGMEQFMGIEPESVEYFVLSTTYTCENTLQDLEGTGIRAPSFTSYLDRIVTFMRENPDVSSAAMV
ncbi:MAG: SDR family oxidoreductase [Candidatus Promineifilaceae bacterium]|nr:SDR family oxidoreductase [Candidatus Promineifilaceae bacterium]